MGEERPPHLRVQLQSVDAALHVDHVPRRLLISEGQHG